MGRKNKMSIQQGLWRCLLTVSLLVGFGGMAGAVEILVVGNSYTSYNGGNKSAKVLEYCIQEDVPPWGFTEVSTVTKGGWTFIKHAADADNPGQTLHTYLTAEDAPPWHAVVLQEQSQTPGFFVVGDALYDASFDGAYSLNEKIKALGSETWFLMTWGRKNGDSGNDWLYGDYLAMQDCLEQGYLNYQNALSTPERAVYVAPAGRAWRLVYLDHEVKGEDPLNSASLFSRLYTGDGSHPAALGSYLTGLVMYGSMTGRSPLQVSVGLNGADEADITLLKEVAHQVIFDGDIEGLNVEGTKLAPYPWVVFLEQETPPAEGTWYLGNGDVRRTYVVGDGPVVANGIQLGNEDPVSPEDGRLVVQDGGTLQASKVTVSGEDSLFILRGGVFEGTEVDGALRHEGGTWLIPEELGLVSGTFTMGSEATLTWGEGGDNSPMLQVTKTATLQGKVVIPDETQNGTLITAASLSTEGLVMTTASGDEVVWEVQIEPEGAMLVVLSGTDPGEEDTQDVPPGEEGGDEPDTVDDSAGEEGGTGEGGAEGDDASSESGDAVVNTDDAQEEGGGDSLPGNEEETDVTSDSGTPSMVASSSADDGCSGGPGNSGVPWVGCLLLGLLMTCRRAHQN